jgi:hypothetical protein
MKPLLIAEATKELHEPLVCFKKPVQLVDRINFVILLGYRHHDCNLFGKHKIEGG